MEKLPECMLRGVSAFRSEGLEQDAWRAAGRGRSKARKEDNSR